MNCMQMFFEVVADFEGLTPTLISLDVELEAVT